MIINTTRKDLFNDYLLWLNPILNLKEMDRKVLSAFLTLHYNYREYPEDTLYSLLFSEDTQRSIAKKLDLSDSQMNKAITNLQEKKLIIDAKLNSHLIQYPKDGNFKINILFKVNEVTREESKREVSKEVSI